MLWLYTIYYYIANSGNSDKTIRKQHIIKIKVRAYIVWGLWGNSCSVPFVESQGFSLFRLGPPTGKNHLSLPSVC